MTAQYAAVLNTWQTMPEADLDRKLNALKKINAAVLALRRAECTARKRSTAGRGALTAWKLDLQFQDARLQL